MDVVYFPDMVISSEETLKALLLFWGRIRTIVPPSQAEQLTSYVAGEVTCFSDPSLDRYKEILDLAREPVLDFLVIADHERERASQKMLELLCTWNRDTGFYNSLKIHSIDDLTNKWFEWYWFLHEKLEQPLVELLLEEKLVVNWAPGEIVGYQDVGKSYMSVIAEEVKVSRNVRLITDDEFCVAAKSGASLIRAPSHPEAEKEYQLVSLAIPQVFLKGDSLKRLSWKKVLDIRQDLLPLADKYHKELESYELEINSYSEAGRDQEAFAKFCEFCERASLSFRPFAKETSKILGAVTSSKTIGFVNGIVLPSVRLTVAEPTLRTICDVAAISSTAGSYVLSKKRPLKGFEYLENLNRRLDMQRLKGLVTCLIPKGLRKLVHD